MAGLAGMRGALDALLAQWQLDDLASGEQLADGTPVGLRQLRRLAPTAVAGLRLTVDTVDDARPVTLQVFR